MERRFLRSTLFSTSLRRFYIIQINFCSFCKLNKLSRKIILEFLYKINMFNILIKKMIKKNKRTNFDKKRAEAFVRDRVRYAERVSRALPPIVKRYR